MEKGHISSFQDLELQRILCGLVSNLTLDHPYEFGSRYADIQQRANAYEHRHKAAHPPATDSDQVSK